MVSIENGECVARTFLPSLNSHGVSGTTTPPGDFGEATLDIELVMGLLGPKQNLTVYQVGETNFNQQPSTIQLSLHLTRLI